MDELYKALQQGPRYQQQSAMRQQQAAMRQQQQQAVNQYLRNKGYGKKRPEERKIVTTKYPEDNNLFDEMIVS